MTSNIFLQQLNESKEKSSSEENVFLNQIKGKELKGKGESFFKSSLRTGLQIPLGYLKKYTWPADVLKLLSEGASKEQLAQLQEEEPELRSGIAEKARERASEFFPTQELAEKLIEEKTGIPLQPKTELQKMGRLAGTAGGFKPGSIQAKTTAGIVAPLAKRGLEEVGVPEAISEVGGLLLSGAAPEIGIETVKKASGLPTRMFEKVKKPTSVSPGRHQKINETLEKDFKTISDEILNKNPDYQSIKSDPEYRTKISDAFQKVEELSQNIPEVVHRRHLSSFMKRRLNTEIREMKGITPSETEETFRKEFADYIKKVSEGPEESRISSLVEQFRKNNGELSEYFEPGKSKAFNTGKRDALLEYNRAIQELFETVHPNSEFTNLFKEQNKRWSQLSDVEFIEGKLNGIFKEGKINFNDISKLLDKSKENLRRPFKRIMGKEGFNDFEKLLKDFNSIKNPYSLLKKAELAGFKDLAKLAGSYIIHPSLTKLYAASKILRNATRVLLDKPQLALTWKDGLDAFKAGKYPEAENKFQELDSEVKKLSEKVKPFESRAKTLPEGYSPEFSEKIYEVNPKYEQYPSREVRNAIKLNEPYTLTSTDSSVPKLDPLPLNHNQSVLYPREWDSLFSNKLFSKYYNPKQGYDLGESFGTVGDFIKNPKLRKIYRDVLDIPIGLGNPISIDSIGAYSPTYKKIYVQRNLSPSDLYGTIIHETHHALQDKFKRFEKLKKYRTAEEYYKQPHEKTARLAERLAQKDLLKARRALEKTYNLQEKERIIKEYEKKHGKRINRDLLK